MASKKNKAKDFFSPVPFWGWNEDDAKDQWKDFKSNVEKLWKQYEDMQKAAKKAWQEQWDTFFTQLMEIQQTVADSLPEEKASLPGMPEAPVSPKEFVEKAKELQEKANAHAVEQTNNLFNFQMEQQKQAKEIVTDTVESIEEDLDEKDEEPVVEEPVVEEPIVEEPAKKPAKKAAEKPAKKAAEKPAAKTAEKPAAKQTKKTAEKPAAKQTKKTTEKPAAKQTKKTAGQPAKKPGRKPAEKPAEQPAEVIQAEAPAENQAGN